MGASRPRFNCSTNVAALTHDLRFVEGSEGLGERWPTGFGDAARLQGRRQRRMQVELPGNLHDVRVLQKDQAPRAVVIRQRAERLRAQSDLRVELQRCLEERQAQYTPHMPSIEISSINSSSSTASSPASAWPTVASSISSVSMPRA